MARSKAAGGTEAKGRKPGAKSAGGKKSSGRKPKRPSGVRAAVVGRIRQFLRIGAGARSGKPGARSSGGKAKSGRKPGRTTGTRAATVGGVRRFLRIGTRAKGRKPAKKSVGRKGTSGAGFEWFAKARSAVFRDVRRFVRACAGITLAVGWRVGVAGAVVFSLAVLYFHFKLPEPSALLDTRTRGTIALLDRENEVFAWRGNQLSAVRADEASPNLVNAVVAAEDGSFHDHFGLSPRGIAGAVFINLREGRGPLSGHGGSTITQQVSKLLCLGVEYDPASGRSEREFERDCRRSTIWRKIKEVPFSLALELKYSKNEILSIYLNRAYLGSGAVGFEAASQRFFGKSIRDVSVPEAAMLAGLLAAPSVYSPTRDISRSHRRANLVIERMRRQGYLTSAEAAEARSSPAGLSQAANNRAGGYFADWIMESGPGFLTHSAIEDFEIRTTYDRDIQAAVDSALTHVFDTKVRVGSKAQAAVVVMTRDGAVRAMVGGRKVDAAGMFNRATQALRQTGSLFKPFVYAAALENGFSFDDRIIDRPVTYNIRGSGPWSPRNYGGGHLGEISLTEGLAHSVNTVAVQLSEQVGRKRVSEIARRMGVGDRLARGPALALGASESTLLDMTSAYAGILGGGRNVEPYGVVDMRLKGGVQSLIGRVDAGGERVFSEDTARQLTYMMRRVVTDGTGRRALIGGREVAGKTGTTQEARDAWFIGFSADYVTGVWMGYDDNTPLTGVTGGGLPADIWREVMVRIHESVLPRPLPMINPVGFRTANTVRGETTGTAPGG